MLDPQAQELLKLIVDRGVPPVETQTPVEARESYRARRLFTQPDPPPIWGVRDHTVSTPEASFQVREYQPTDRDGGPMRPALVYFHGGGWTIGDLDTHDTLCRTLSLETGYVVVSVDYRMGPEVRFPQLTTTAWRPSNGLFAMRTPWESTPRRLRWAATVPAATWLPPCPWACGVKP